MSGINLPTGYPQQWNPTTFSAWSYFKVFCCVSLPPLKQVSDAKCAYTVMSQKSTHLWKSTHMQMSTNIWKSAEPLTFVLH